MKISLRNILMILLMFSVMVVLFTGCAANKGVAVNKQAPVEPAKLTFTPKADVEYMIDAYDPWEGFNRQMYVFNYYFDTYFFLPIVKGYAFITPDYVEGRITSFFKNISELKNFTNCMFQLKAKDTGVTLGRFVTNSTIGLAGFYDPSTHFGWQRRNEDFGQTLGHYGAGPGPYLVVPMIGPSCLRDGSGLMFDAGVRWVAHGAVLDNASDKNRILNVVDLLAVIDARHRVAFRYYKSGSPFEYELIRRLYLNMRDIQIAQ
jgi:phospholipid-binding lipoprotein MlaA